MAVPLFLSQNAFASNEIVTSGAPQGWYVRPGDPATGGGADYVADSNALLGAGALKLSTSSDVNSLIHVTHDFGIPLSQVANLSYSTKQLAASDITSGNATLRVSLSLSGGTTQDEQLMYEPYYNGFNGNAQTGWQTWNLMTGKFWSNWGNTYKGKGGAGAGGYDTNFTIADVLSDYPNAKVIGLILSMGDYNVSQQVLVDNVKLNDTTYDFEPNQLAAPTNLAPAGNSYTSNASFDNTWAAVDGAVKYEYKTTYELNGVSQTYQDTSDAGNYVLSGPTIIRHNSGAPESTYSWQVRGIDSNGNPGRWSDVSDVTVDHTAPAVPTGIYYKDTANGDRVDCGQKTSAKNLSVYWNANTETDLDHYEYISYNADGSTGPLREFTTNYFDASWWTIPVEGTYGAQIRAVDKAGNKSDWSGGAQSVQNSCTYATDWTAPTAKLVFPTTGYGAKSFQLVFSEDMNKTDAETPANYFLNNWPYYAGNNNANGSEGLGSNVNIIYDNNNHTATVTFKNSGWYIDVEQNWGVRNIHDLAGNAISETIQPSTEMVAPVTTDSGTDSNWHNSAVIVNLSCTDVSGSGCDKTYYTTDGTTPTISSQSGNQITLSQDGIHTINYFSVDKAGNAENIKTAANTVKIDTVKPEKVQITSPNNGDYFKSSPITDRWTSSSDNGSGVKVYI
jgi:hypothetical protein